MIDLILQCCHNTSSVFIEFKVSLRNIADFHRLEDKSANKKGSSADTLQRLVAKVEKFIENNRALGLPAVPKRTLVEDFVILSS